MSGFVVQGVIRSTVIVRGQGGNSYFFKEKMKMLFGLHAHVCSRTLLIKP